MSDHTSKSAVIVSLLGNSSIAIAKIVGFFITQSGSMAAEAIHSLADCGNQALLLVGLNRSQLPATEKRPLGHGREMYFFAMIVAVLMFFLGGVFSLVEGYDRLMHPHPVEHIMIGIGIIIYAFVAEGLSFRKAMKTLKQERGDKSLWQWFKDTSNSELMVVAGEDIAAMAGLTIALVALLLAVYTGNPAYDAVGSLLVGALMVVVALAVMRELQGLVVGEAANPAINQSVCEIAAKHGFIAFEVKAVQHGHEVLVNTKLEPSDGMSLQSAMRGTVAFEADLLATHPACRWMQTELGMRGQSPT